MNKIFDYTKWEILDTYQYEQVWYCIQVRMNKRTGFKKFKVTRITKYFTSCYSTEIKTDRINSLTNKTDGNTNSSKEV